MFDGNEIKRSNSRLTIGAIGAIAAFVAAMFLGMSIGDYLKVPTMLSVEPHTVHFGAGAEAEVDSAMTTFGLGFMLLSVLAAIGAWHLIAGQPGRPEGYAAFAGWFVGALLVTLGGALLWRSLAPVRGDDWTYINMGNVIIVVVAAIAGTKLTNWLWARIKARRAVSPVG